MINNIEKDIFHKDVYWGFSDFWITCIVYQSKDELKQRKTNFLGLFR